jgi:hypothetical protein
MTQGSSFFQQIAAEPGKMEAELLGPPYSYFKEIKTPSELGMSGHGSLGALATNVGGLTSYTELLVTGGGDATATGKPLGNQFFLKTGGTCKDKSTSRQADRFMYVNNVPDGSIPFITSGMGVQFTTFEGIIPGILSDLSQLNPLSILKGFMEGSTPDCQDVSLPVTGQDGISRLETRHVPTSELAGMQPCIFPGKKNPATGEPCREAFTNKQTKGITASASVGISMSLALVLLLLIIKLARAKN